ncbi:hypothetical protein DU506_00345 [Vreelandella rituensis]|uniref:Uncharacterized protein n=2 Tax=Vreelandella rituensis TaxID=2282306 RepID=A0A368U8X1_9GAMM|nr:hypothetical protein DU506_00345 [Halomonas rituensis]
MKYVAMSCGGSAEFASGRPEKKPSRRQQKKPINLFVVGGIALTLAIAGFWSYKQWFRTASLFTGDTPESVYFQELSYSLSAEYGKTMTILPAWHGDEQAMGEVFTSQGLNYYKKIKSIEFGTGKNVRLTSRLLSSHICFIWGQDMNSYKDFIDLYEEGDIDQKPSYRAQFFLNHEIGHCIQGAMPSWKWKVKDSDIIERISLVIDVYDQESLEMLINRRQDHSLYNHYILESFADLYALHKLSSQQPAFFTPLMNQHFFNRNVTSRRGYLHYLTQIHMREGIQNLKYYKHRSSGEFAEATLNSVKQRSDIGFLDDLIIGHIADTMDASAYRVLQPEKFRKAVDMYQKVTKRSL